MSKSVKEFMNGLKEKERAKEEEKRRKEQEKKWQAEREAAQKEAQRRYEEQEKRRKEEQAERQRQYEWERDRPMREAAERTRQHAAQLAASAAADRQRMQDQLDFQAAQQSQHADYLEQIRRLEGELYRERLARASDLTRRKIETAQQITALLKPPKKD